MSNSGAIEECGRLSDLLRNDYPLVYKDRDKIAASFFGYPDEWGGVYCASQPIDYLATLYNVSREVIENAIRLSDAVSEI